MNSVTGFELPFQKHGFTNIPFILLKYKIFVCDSSKDILVSCEERIAKAAIHLSPKLKKQLAFVCPWGNLKNLSLTGGT